MSDISKKGVRDSLAPRREPYWNRVGENTFLGCRKTDKGSETWVARHQQGKIKQYRRLGAVSTVKYGEAVKLAIKFGDERRQGIGKAPTVAQACKDYLENRRTRSGEAAATDIGGRLKRTVLSDAIAEIHLDRLTVTAVEKWQTRRIESGNNPNTINRDFRFLKAALNFAFRQDRVATTPWKKVDALPSVPGAREEYLTLEQRKRLLEASAPPLAAFLKGLLYTGCRTGELRNVKVKDYDKATGTLTVTTHKGKGSAARTRSVSLSDAAQAFFTEQCRSKFPTADLFTQRTGRPWSKPALNAQFRKVRTASGLPETIVPYVCRHTAISNWLSAGIDVASAAKMAGTSIEMIERHYHKFIRPVIADKLNQIEEV